MRYPGVVITPSFMRYATVAITPYSMRYARVEMSLTIDVSTVRMVANHRKWGLSVPYSGRRTVSHNRANVYVFHSESSTFYKSPFSTLVPFVITTVLITQPFITVSSFP